MPTYYIGNLQDSNSVINLMFLYANLEELNCHAIFPNFREFSDYTSLFIYIIIKKEFIKRRS